MPTSAGTAWEHAPQCSHIITQPCTRKQSSRCYHRPLTFLPLPISTHAAANAQQPRIHTSFREYTGALLGSSCTADGRRVAGWWPRGARGLCSLLSQAKAARSDRDGCRGGGYRLGARSIPCIIALHSRVHTLRILSSLPSASWIIHDQQITIAL